MQLKPLCERPHPFDATVHGGPVEDVAELVGSTVIQIKILVGLIYYAIDGIPKQKIVIILAPTPSPAPLVPWSEDQSIPIDRTDRIKPGLCGLLPMALRCVRLVHQAEPIDSLVANNRSSHFTREIGESFDRYAVCTDKDLVTL